MNNYYGMFSVFDMIDEIVYVCDIESYDLVYCNKKTKEEMALEYTAGQSGQKCYKYLHGMDYPCIFCNNEKLKEEKSCVWNRVNPTSGDNFFIHDSLIQIDDRRCRLELAVNASNLQPYEEHSEKIGQIENYLTQCVRQLVQSEDFDQAVHTVLQAVLDFYGAERAYLFDFDWNKQISNNTHEVCAAGISPEKDNLQNVSVSEMYFWIKVFSKKTVLKIENLDLIKEDLSRREEYNTLSAQGIHSIIAVPIFENEKLTGFVGVDNPKRMIENTEFIEELSYFIGTEVSKNQYFSRLIETSYFDAMCGVANRNSYVHLVENIQKQQYKTIGIAFLDMNGLKYLNDNFGHAYGDRQIKKFCNILLLYYKKEQIFRISGDEFVIVDVDASYNRFNAKMKQLKINLNEHEKEIAAIGYIWDDSQAPINVLKNQAEQIMMAQKQKYYISDINLGRGARPKYIADMIESLKQDSYMVYLQPKYCIAEERVYGAEALIRKLDEEGRIVYPAEFVSAMERENAISFVDFFVFEKICETLKRWEKTEYSEMVISTNFSRSTIAENDFTEHVLNILKKTGINGNQLIIEITETSNIVHIKKLTDIMKRLKHHGIRFALDDMGTEYATLEMLELEGLDMAKFDKSLIQRIPRETRGQKILKKLVEMCHDLDMECIAEGVETKEQFEAVKEVGCDRIQGYLIGKPMPIKEFEERINIGFAMNGEKC